MSTVKFGYGHHDYYGHGHSKPLIHYHTQEAPASVTTVVTETSGMRVNEKPPYNGAGAVQEKHAFLQEDSGHRGGTVQKHGGSAALTRQYKHEEVSDSSEESGDESDCEEELAYGTSGVQKAYQNGGDVGGYGAFRHDYGGKQVYQDGGYGARHDDSTVQKKLGYGEQKAYQGDVAGHDSLVQRRAAQMHAYGEQNTRGLDLGYQSQEKGRFLQIWPRRRWWWWL